MLRKVKIIPDVTEYKPKYKVFVDEPVRIYGLNPGVFICSKEEALQYNMLHIVYDSSGPDSNKNTGRIVSKTFSVQSLLYQVTNSYNGIIVFRNEATPSDGVAFGVGFHKTENKLMVGTYVNHISNNASQFTPLSKNSWLYYLALSD